MVRSWLSRFMAGRYGGDQLNLFLIALYLVLYVLYLVLYAVFLFPWLVVLELIGSALLLVSLFRSLSRNIERRREENARFLQIFRPVRRKWTGFRVRAHDKEHRYFKCPNCGQQMRVPRGKGRITVHCRTCGAAFEEKS